MNEQEIFEFLKTNGLLVFYGIRGSHLYGTNIETSDVDHHGIYMPNIRDWLRLSDPREDFSDAKRDVTVYELKKYVSLATTANPTVLEMMFTPSDFVLFESNISRHLFSFKEMFITKKCFYSFSGYARDQIKKAKGKNKKVMNEPKYYHEPGINKLKNLLSQDKISSEWVEIRFSKPFMAFLSKLLGRAPLSQNTCFGDMDFYLEDEDVARLLPPKRNEFCYVIPRPKMDVNDQLVEMPSRPVPLNELGINLEHFNCSSVEHIGNVYRLYHYGENANGVFKGGEVFCSSIPIEHEKTLYYGLLIYSLTEYESAKSDWKSFWEWMANRNEDRWRSQDSNQNFEYDRKNMQHTVRLLLSAEHIARKGVPLIRFSGNKLDFLRRIRAGEYDYDYLMEFANEKVLSLEQTFKESGLPDACNTVAVSKLYDELIDMRLDTLRA